MPLIKQNMASKCDMLVAVSGGTVSCQ